jgi:hypothetical protein
MIYASSLLSTAVRRSGAVLSSRASSSCAAAQKLRCVFEEYRLEKYVSARQLLDLRIVPLINLSYSYPSLLLCSYSRETPTRFKKDLAKAISSNNGTVEVDQLNHFLVNIGHPEALVSNEEFKTLLTEAGVTSRYIKATDMLRLV